MALIYQCKNNITQKAYIGITIRPLDIRKWEHTKELNSGKKGGTWQEEYNLHGKNAFSYLILKEDVPLENILEEENRLILQYNTLQPHGYNKKLNGNTKGYTFRDYLKTSNFSIIELKNLLQDILSIDPFLSMLEISEKYDITQGSLQDIIRCKSHVWIKMYLPEDYCVLEDMHASSIERGSYLNRHKFLKALELYGNKNNTDNYIAHICNLTVNQLRDLVRGKAFLWAKEEFPLEYAKACNLYKLNNIKKEHSIIDTSNGEIFTFTKITDISVILGIDARRVGELVSKKRISLSKGRYILGSNHGYEQ